MLGGIHIRRKEGRLMEHTNMNCAYGAMENLQPWCYKLAQPCEYPESCEHWKEFARCKDMVHHPAHYTKTDKEFWDAMCDMLSKDEYLGALKYNAMKYIYRCPSKDEPAQELDKAIAYINKMKEVYCG